MTIQFNKYPFSKYTKFSVDVCGGEYIVSLKKEMYPDSELSAFNGTLKSIYNQTSITKREIEYFFKESFGVKADLDVLGFPYEGTAFYNESDSVLFCDLQADVHVLSGQQDHFLSRIDGSIVVAESNVINGAYPWKKDTRMTSLEIIHFMKGHESLALNLVAKANGLPEDLFVEKLTDENIDYIMNHLRIPKSMLKTQEEHVKNEESSATVQPDALSSMIDKSTGKPIKMSSAYARFHGEKIGDYVNRIREGLKSWVTAVVLPSSSGEWTIILVTKEAIIHVRTTPIEYVDTSEQSVFHSYEKSPSVIKVGNLTEEGKYLRSADRYELASFMVIKGMNVMIMSHGDIEFYDDDGNTIFVMPKSTTNIIR